MKIFHGNFTCAEDVFKYWNESFDANIEFIFASRTTASAFCLFIIDGIFYRRERGGEPFVDSLDFWLNTTFAQESNKQAQANLRKRFAKILPFV